MCGRLQIISTTRCCVAIMEIVARQQHPSVHFCALPCLNSKAVSLFLMVCNSHQLVWPGVGVPTRLVEAERLYQFIQQSSYTVVLLGRAGYGFVAHGADAAHLQPLYQTPAQRNTDRTGMRKKKAGLTSTKSSMFNSLVIFSQSGKLMTHA